MIMFDQLRMSQFKDQMRKIQGLKGTIRPSSGWIRTIRELYGMSLSFVAKKAGVVQSRVSTVEAYEPEDRLTIGTLRQFANALNCDLVYVLIPREDPEKFLEKHAQKKAKLMVAQLQRTMALEDQAIADKELDRHYKQLIQELLANPKKIWEGS